MMIDEDTGETIDPRELQGQWSGGYVVMPPFYIPLQVSRIYTTNSGSNEIIIENYQDTTTGNSSNEFILDSYGYSAFQYTTPNWRRECMGVWDSYGTGRTNPCVEVPLGPRQIKLLVDDRVSIIDVPEVEGDYFIEMENQKDIKECFFCGGELSKQGCWNVCCECDSRK